MTDAPKNAQLFGKIGSHFRFAISFKYKRPRELQTQHSRPICILIYSVCGALCFETFPDGK